MTVALQTREVPDAVQDVLAAEAERQGQSVQAALLAVDERGDADPGGRHGSGRRRCWWPVRCAPPDDDLLAHVWGHRHDLSPDDAPDVAPVARFGVAPVVTDTRLARAARAPRGGDDRSGTPWSSRGVRLVGPDGRAPRGS